MAGTAAKITRAAVSNLGRGDWINDSSLPGFKVRRPNRLALYGLNIRLQGRMRWITLGSEAELTPDQARAEAERLRGLKRQGIDVAADRDRRKGCVTLEEAAKRFLAQHVQKKLRTRTAQHYDETLYRLILPHFGSWRVDSLKNADIAQWHGGMSATSTQANRALAILSSLMSWTVHQRWRADNPCRGIARFRERRVQFFPTASQMAQISKTIDEMVEQGGLNLFFGAGTKLLMMTGARRSEVFNARWEWLDCENRCLLLPDSKTGAKVIALPHACFTIIMALPRLAGCPWIFPSVKTNRPFVNFGAQWKLVLQRANVGHWRLHDLRHGFASAAASSGVPIYAIGKQLGHSRPQTTARYSHLSNDELRSVAETVAALLSAKGVRTC